MLTGLIRKCPFVVFLLLLFICPAKSGELIRAFVSNTLLKPKFLADTISYNGAKWGLFFYRVDSFQFPSGYSGFQQEFRFKDIRSGQLVKSTYYKRSSSSPSDNPIKQSETSFSYSRDSVYVGSATYLYKDGLVRYSHNTAEVPLPWVKGDLTKYPEFFYFYSQRGILDSIVNCTKGNYNGSVGSGAAGCYVYFSFIYKQPVQGTSVPEMRDRSEGDSIDFVSVRWKQKGDTLWQYQPQSKNLSTQYVGPLKLGFSDMMHFSDSLYNKSTTDSIYELVDTLFVIRTSNTFSTGNKDRFTQKYIRMTDSPIGMRRAQNKNGGINGDFPIYFGRYEFKERLFDILGGTLKATAK